MITLLTKFLQLLINFAGSILTLLLSVFPASPFTIIKDSQFNELISKINYFIPVYEFIAIMQTWLIAIGIYYLWSIYARWVKAID